MAKLELTYSEVYTRISEYLGLTAFNTAPTSTDLTRCKTIAERGYRRFLWPIDLESKLPHYWSFLRKQGQLSTVINKWQYALPEDFINFVIGPKFRAGENYSNPELKPQSVIVANRTISTTAGLPKYYSLVNTAFDKETGYYKELWLDPKPDVVYNYYYTYIFSPDKPENSTDLFVGGAIAAETILQCCLAAAELQEKPEQLQQGQAGYQEAKAAEMLQVLIRNDRLQPLETDPNLSGVVVLQAPTNVPVAGAV